MDYRVGVDIGGTFTDFAVLDSDHKVYTFKVFSTPSHPGQEVIAGLRGLKDRYGIDPSDIRYFTHGSTVGVNSIIQRTGAVVALLTTRNFDDVLELGRLEIPDPLNLRSLRAEPLVHKQNVFQVTERTAWDGSIITPLDEAEVQATIEAVVARQVEGLVVALLHSYRNPAHEQRIKAIASKIAPDLIVTCSSDVWPVIREYERTTTAVLNAYVQPKMARYLTSLQAALRNEGVHIEPQITKSNGGVMRAELGKSNCVDVLLSGTASGVTAGAYVARLAGFKHVASVDIGGTSADVSLIIDGKPSFGTGQTIGEFSLLIPSVSVSSVGGGGGSIAWLDDLGVLKSGPLSAGSEPGPACYGRGGTRPTTTDAFVVCGFLGQAELAYGTVAIDRAKAEAAVGSLAAALGKPIRDVAESIIEVATSGMYAEMAKTFAAQGEDPRNFALMPFGGAGPMLACFLARELGIGTLIIPPTPGVMCALGGLLADTKNDFIQTVYCDAQDQNAGLLSSAFAQLRAKAVEWLRSEQEHARAFNLSLSADMRYVGQSFEIEVAVEDGWVEDHDVGRISRAFHEQHQRIYGYSDPLAPVQIVNVRTVIASPNPEPSFPAEEEQHYEPDAERHVEIYYDRRPWQTALHYREALRPGATIDGPAIIAQSDTTICILPGFRATVDRYRNVIVRVMA